MNLVSTVTVGSGGASSIEFQSIPQIGTQILITVSARSASSTQINLTFNGSSSLYGLGEMRGDGSTISTIISTSRANLYFLGASLIGTANMFGSSQILISNYTSVNPKQVFIESVNENNAQLAYQNLIAGEWRGDQAITSVILSNSFSEFTTASLYVITAD